MTTTNPAAAALAQLDCDACANGCTCQGGTPGCEHFACWGVGATNSCPDAAPRLARLRARTTVGEWLS